MWFKLELFLIVPSFPHLIDNSFPSTPLCFLVGSHTSSFVCWSWLCHQEFQFKTWLFTLRIGISKILREESKGALRALTLTVSILVFLIAVIFPFSAYCRSQIIQIKGYFERKWWESILIYHPNSNISFECFCPFHMQMCFMANLRSCTTAHLLPLNMITVVMMLRSLHVSNNCIISYWL